MKRFIQERWPWLEEARGMRSQLLDILSNADLSFSPGGQNLTLGALLHRMTSLDLIAQCLLNHRRLLYRDVFVDAPSLPPILLMLSASRLTKRDIHAGTYASCRRREFFPP